LEQPSRLFVCQQSAPLFSADISMSQPLGRGRLTFIRPSLVMSKNTRMSNLPASAPFPVYREFPFWEPPSFLRVKSSVIRFQKTVKQKRAFFEKKMKIFSFFQFFTKLNVFCRRFRKKDMLKIMAFGFFPQTTQLNHG
jgi:hypothetical protein